MEFLEHLKNEYDVERLRTSYLMCGLSPMDLPQKSKGIEFNDGLVLSIQGSFGHYCRPRETLPYNQYKAMEFALITENGFADVNQFIDTDEYDEYFDGSVYGFVPVELIEKLYQALKQKFGLKPCPKMKNKTISMKLIAEIQRLSMEHFEALDTDYPDYRVVTAKERAIWNRLSKITSDESEQGKILDAIEQGQWQVDDKTYKPICDRIRSLGYEIIYKEKK